jgi:pantetheine-phosphate adenylyltransferase
MNNSIAVYSGTFDPLTRGHEDLVRRASGLFQKVIIAIAESRKKQPLFTWPSASISPSGYFPTIPMSKIQGFDSLLMDFMRKQGASIILRGLRAVSDFEYEFQMAGMNRSLYPDVETVFLTPDENYMFISATMVREIATLGGDVSKFVHPLVSND